ncbi:MAG: TadA family conjugal transfer-associated ATPase [Candidatus Nanopelagicales bacterium]
MTASLLERVRTRLIAGHGEATPAHVAAALREEGVLLGDSAVLELVEVLRRELLGAGRLDPLLRNPSITDVLVNAPDSVWIDEGAGLVRSDTRFTGEDEVRRLAQRLAASAGRRLDEASPFVDAQLANGARLHAVLPPLSSAGTAISIRVPRSKGFTLSELCDSGSATLTMVELLGAMIDARMSFVISGGTGAGKTTVLGALLSRLGDHERLILVEDSAELSPDCGHVVRMQARTANVEGAGIITMRDLVRQSLRMRPDRICIGEVRGVEVVELLTALNTGQEGGCGTVHANSAEDVPARLEALALMAGVDRPAVHSLMCAGLDCIVHVDRTQSGQRVIRGIYALERGHDSLATIREVAVTASGRTRLGEAYEEFKRTVTSRIGGSA